MNAAKPHLGEKSGRFFRIAVFCTTPISEEHRRVAREPVLTIPRFLERASLSTIDALCYSCGPRAGSGMRVSRFAPAASSRPRSVIMGIYSPAAQAREKAEYRGDRGLPDWPPEWMNSDACGSARS